MQFRTCFRAGNMLAGGVLCRGFYI